MNELVRWGSGAVYVNGWLVVGLAFGIAAAYCLGRIIVEAFE